MVRRAALDQILGEEEVFAAGAIKSRVVFWENVLGTPRPPELVHFANVRLLGGVDEAIIDDLEMIGQLPELC